MITSDKLSEFRRVVSEYELLYEGQKAEDHTVIAVNHVDDGRWFRVKQVVIRIPTGELLAFHFGEGATELQEDDYPWEYGEDWEVQEVVPVEVTRIEYQKKV